MCRFYRCIKMRWVIAFLWHQGEGDSGSISEANQYAVKLKNIFNIFRAAHRSHGSIPVLQGELVPSWKAPCK